MKFEQFNSFPVTVTTFPLKTCEIIIFKLIVFIRGKKKKNVQFFLRYTFLYFVFRLYVRPVVLAEWVYGTSY